MNKEKNKNYNKEKDSIKSTKVYRKSKIETKFIQDMKEKNKK